MGINYRIDNISNSIKKYGQKQAAIKCLYEGHLKFIEIG